MPPLNVFDPRSILKFHIYPHQQRFMKWRETTSQMKLQMLSERIWAWLLAKALISII